ncbi:uncharacterized protein LOC126408235 isoform X2 [Epinephelus moara]|uniref:uncharacterized protein LOC126408235 isoform X2 n=1 Tax=Epinephelus moara TaxID=300413 RepID=UPI00214E1FC6|nr:uncharacterized protein LOC126408235 isoform X2 [Epinephelus moara]
MLQSFLTNKNPIVSTLAVTNAPVHPLSQEEWTTVQEMCTILKPFEEVTVELSAQSYMTASKVILLAKGLQRATTQAAKDMVNSLCSNMSARFHRMESTHILADAAALDPRFKTMAFMDGRTADETFQRISTAAARLTLSSSEPIQQPVQEEGAGSAAPESIVWSYFHEKEAGTVSTRNPTADAVMEVRAYLEEPLVPKNEVESNMECGLVAGEVSVHLLGTAEVPLSKAPNPPTAQGA